MEQIYSAHYAATQPHSPIYAMSLTTSIQKKLLTSTSAINAQHYPPNPSPQILKTTIPPAPISLTITREKTSSNNYITLSKTPTIAGSCGLLGPTYMATNTRIMVQETALSPNI
jgi:hypothetical protein